MRNFLILLFSVTIFCANSQTVTIPSDAAKWYLEQADKAALLTEQVKIKNEALANFEKRIKTQQAIIHTYEEDNQSYREVIATKNSQITLLENSLELSKKEIKKQRTQKLVAIGGGTGAAIGSVVGQPIVGMAIGVGVGYVVGILKKK